MRNTPRGGRARTRPRGTLGDMELIGVALLFVGLAVLAAVPLVVLLHLSSGRSHGPHR